MGSKDYFLLMKTATSEHRAWSNLEADVKSKITPIFEITRGRKKRGTRKGTAEELLGFPEIYSYEDNLQKFEKASSDCKTVFYDLTHEDALSCFEIEKIRNSQNGYSNWCGFIESRIGQLEAAIVPVLQINPAPDDGYEEFSDNLTKQVERLYNRFEAVAYRAAIQIDSDFLYDLDIIAALTNKVTEQGKLFYLLLDHEFIRPQSASIHAQITTDIINRAKQIIPSLVPIVLATSYPRNVVELVGQESGHIPVEEMRLYSQISNAIDVLYGDYGSINPIRNDEIIMSQGWIPKVEFVAPISNEILNTFYFRERRENLGKIPDPKKPERNKTRWGSYKPAYIKAAQSAISNRYFPAKDSQSWGVNQILEVANSNEANFGSRSTPSFWISVRMEIHIRQVYISLAFS